MTQSVISNVRYLYDIFIVQKNKEVPIMKKRSSFTKKLIATCAAVAMVVASMSSAVFADVEAAQSGSSAFIGFSTARKGFNVYGISGSGTIKTTFSNAGYGTTIKVGDEGSVDTVDSGFAYGKDYSVAGITAHLTAAINDTGKAVIITYTVVNTTDVQKNVQIGSYSDCMIGNNDSAPVRVHNNGLSMTDGTNNFFLIPGNGDFTTMWSGGCGGARSNVFNNASSHEYNGDSGLAWSWSLDVPAGETVTRTAVLEADFQTVTLAFDANGGTGAMDSCLVVSGLQSTIPSNAFTRNGYEFLGWATSADATDPQYRNNGYIAITSDTTLYAIWNQVAPVEAIASEEPAGRELTYNGQPQALAVPGSSDEGTMVYSLSPNGPFTTDVPTATSSGTYTVYYKIEGDDTHEDSAVSSFEVTIEGLTVTANVNGTEVTVNAESTLERPADPTRDGYDFGGWYADEACTTAYNFNAPVGTSGATLYPKWIPIEYTLTEGANGSWTRGGEDGLVFRATRTNNGEATFEHFTGVKVDDNTLGTSNYAATSGSVIVTLTPAYLATLAEGEHTLEIMFNDGSSVTTTFIIAAQVVETTAAETTAAETTAAETSAAETTATPTETTAAATSGVASTGETQTSSTAPIGIAILMIAGAATLIFIVRKREENS